MFVLYLGKNTPSLPHTETYYF